MARAQRLYLPPNPTVRCGDALVRTWPAVAAVFVCVLGTALAAPAQAQDGDASSLRQQVQTLTQRVDKLEAEVHALQHVQATHSPMSGQAPMARQAPMAEQPAMAGRPAVTVNQSFGAEADLRHAWHQLKRGMTAADVKKLLGPPSGQFRTGNITVWYYHYTGVGSGSVTISQDGKLDDWQQPSHGL